MEASWILLSIYCFICTMLIGLFFNGLRPRDEEVWTAEILHEFRGGFVDSRGLRVFLGGGCFFIMLYSLQRKKTSYFSVEQVFLTKPSSSPGEIQISPERESEMEQKIQREGG